MALPPPKWITPFFYISIVFALVVLLSVLFHDSRKSELGTHHISDITINLGGKRVREHCTTCHIDGGRPDSGDLSKIIRTHPDISPHRIDQLGCTGCHLGEGMALDLEISHGLPGLGAREVLSGKEMQASCFRCHVPGPLVGAEQAWKGYQRFYTSACNTCHKVDRAGTAGLYGPDLSHIGSSLGLGQLLEAIREPRKAPVNSKMPRFPLSKGQATQISYYLKSLTGTPYYATPMQLQTGMVKIADVDLVPDDMDLTEDIQLLYRSQCLACHKFSDIDGRIGPDLTYVGAQRNAEHLKGFMLNPTRFIPGAAMPRVPMTDSVLQNLVIFLSTKAVGPLSEGGAHDEMISPHRQGGSDSVGKHLYMQLCQRCHAAEGNGRGPIQPNLATFPRAFLDNADFFRSITDKRVNDSILDGIPGTSMPGYRRLLSPSQLDQVLDLVFTAFVGIDRHEKSPQHLLPDKPENLPAKTTTDSLYRENCQRCHGAFGTGTGPDALDYLPRPRNLRNGPYMKSLSDKRILGVIFNGVPGTAMPAFRDHLPPQNVWGLVEKVKAFSHALGSEQ